jgi:endo-1,4-beta-xylanase
MSCGSEDTDPAPETLAALARARGIRAGAFVWGLGEDQPAGMVETALREFDLFTLPAFFRIVEPERGAFDFRIPDGVVDRTPAAATFRVHGPVECDLLADWIEDGNFTAAELEAILIAHVTAVVQHYETTYPGRIAAYNVVNEPFSFTGDGCPWHSIGIEAGTGELEYIRIALRTARAAAPDTPLYLNDFHIEGLGEKSDRMYQLASELLAEGIPLDGIGLESHFAVDSSELFGPMPPVDEIVANIERLGALGLEVMISEADLSIRNADRSTETLDDQARDYRALMRACLSSSACVAFLTWGVGDADSWIPDAFPEWGAPLLFDEDYRPKPAYHAVMAELRGQRAHAIVVH